MPKKRKVNPAILLVLIVLIVGISYWWSFLRPCEVEIGELISNPQKYDGKTVKVSGFLLKNIDPNLHFYWGHPYDLLARPLEQVEKPAKVAISSTVKVSAAELDIHVRYTWDGNKYEAMPFIAGSVTVVEGKFVDNTGASGHYATDSPPCWIEVSKIYSTAPM